MTAPILAIDVLGTPRPKGSLRPFVAPNGKPRVREQLEGSPDWRSAVANAAYEAIRGRDRDMTAPVKVLIELRFTPPKKPKNPLPTSRTTGDVDKHARNILDALQDATVVKDDAQVVDLRVSKRYGVPAGAAITVWPATPPEHPLSGAAAVDDRRRAGAGRSVHA